MDRRTSLTAVGRSFSGRTTAATAFVTATLPPWLIERVQQELPLVKLLKGNSLHRTASGVKETLIDCSAGERVRGDGDAGFALKVRLALT